MKDTYDVAIVGAGFCGLTAAYFLAKKGKKVVLIEQDSEPGGLAGTFHFDGDIKIEKFYHHWFNNDEYVPMIVNELGLQDKIVAKPSNTGMYFNGKHWRLSKPLDLLKFKPLSFINRFRLGWLTIQVRKITDWKSIEHLTIKEWLVPLCGEQVYQTVWEPLIRSKFSIYADKVGAVWFWNKLVLRGGTRNKSGGEELLYFRGGFGDLANALAAKIEEMGGIFIYNTGAQSVQLDASGKRVESVVLNNHDTVQAEKFLFTPAFPIVADVFDKAAEPTWTQSLRRVNYLGNMCLVLLMNKSLSETYWLNVNDPGFPFVGVIEHTNFDPPENYKGKHIVFLSRYLATSDTVWAMTDDEFYAYALEHLQKMFPEFEQSWVDDYKVWRAEYAQPVTECGYSEYLPPKTTPFENVYLSNMAHIYPQDRGTNYAIRDGKDIAEQISS